MRKTSVTLFVCLAMLCHACGQAEFGGGVTQTPANPTGGDDGTVAPTPKPTTPDSTPTPGANGTRIYQFTGNELGAPVDVVLTVDNSSSMSEEAAHVRSNVADFISAVEGFADLRLSLISEKQSGGGGTGVTLSDASLAKGYQQIDNRVESTNLLSMAASASCPDSETNTRLASPRVCNRLLTNEYIESTENTDEVRGQLSSYLRSTARHIYIFVTDDEPRGVLVSDFKAMLQPRAPKGLNVFAFRGTDPMTSSCSVTTSGAQYDALASQTGGQVFDICEQNWKPYFESITAKIRDYTDPGYAIPAGAVVLNVKFNGMVLEANEYRIENNVLRLASNIRTSKKDKIEVVTQK